MEEDLELRFVCKLCDKRYPCGKSLGGHMRSHVIANSAESDEKLEPNVTKESSPLNGGKFLKDSGFELGGHSGYGLRENPRKTWRVSGSNLPSQQEKICKQCGKGFQSLKALCGHMACHSSEKGRVMKDDHSWNSENQKLAMDSQSDTESEAPRLQPKRSASSSTRYKRIVIKSSSLVNGSSSVSEIDHEQEEVAICLMMLSRDSGSWVGFNSFADSSDNNSVVLETKSSSNDLRIGRNKGLNCSQNGDETSEIKKLGKGKFKSGDLEEDEHAQSESSDSGYFMNGPKKVDSDVSIDGFLTNDNFKNQKLESRPRFKLSDAELGKGLINKAKCRGTELRNGLSNQKVYNEGGIASNSNHSKKRIANCSYNPDSYGATYKKMSKGYPNVENAPKRSKPESGGGNKKQTVQTSSFNGDRRLKSKKSKGHECPICHRVFKSGQALGGHKRSHFLGGSEQKSNQTVQTSVTKEEEISDIPELLDLNLPAPPEEEASEHTQFVPW